MNSTPLVSVIVPTKDSARTISTCLESIRDQSYPSVELMVVDNNSSDGTETIARRYGAILLQRGPERSAQVNFGVLRSHGEYVYRVDSDMVVGRGVIAEAVDVCERGKVDGVIIRVLSDPSVSFWSRVRSLERMKMYYYGNNVAIRFLSRQAFDRIGGFDETLSGFEDYDLHDRFLRAGFRYGRIKSNEVHLGEPQSLADVVRKHFYYGRYLGRYLSKDVSRARRLSLVRPGQLSTIKSLFHDPRLLAGFVTYQLIRYLSALLGAITNI